MDSGKVCAEIVNGATDSVKITYETTGTNVCLKEVQAYLGDVIPVGATGNPKIGNFPLKYTMPTTGECVTEYSFDMNIKLIPDCTTGAEFMDRVFKLAAHATVKFMDGSEETAWSVGPAIASGGSWATYSEVKLNCECATGSPTVIPTGSPTATPVAFAKVAGVTCPIPSSRIILFRSDTAGPVEIPPDYLKRST